MNRISSLFGLEQLDYVALEILECWFDHVAYGLEERVSQTEVDAIIRRIPRRAESAIPVSPSQPRPLAMRLMTRCLDTLARIKLVRAVAVRIAARSAD